MQKQRLDRSKLIGLVSLVKSARIHLCKRKIGKLAKFRNREERITAVSVGSVGQCR